MFLGDNGFTYKVTEMVNANPPDIPDNATMCSHQVSDGDDTLTPDDDVFTVAYPERVGNAQITRASPTVAVFQTVITY